MYICLGKCLNNWKMFLEQKYISSEIRKIVANENVVPLFLYTGIYNYQAVNTHLVTIKEYLETHIESKQLVRKIYRVLVECVENINKHGFSFKRENSINSIYGYVVLAADDEKYTIYVGNFVSNDEIGSIKIMFETVTELERDALKEAYNNKLHNTELSSKQGMGIGIIDIALMAKKPIKYATQIFNDDVSFFTLEIIIPKVL